ncbi:hypothetical protein MTO96_021429 [Rhipicephalus appendiculatus]
MASEESREPGAGEQSMENEVVKQSSPNAKELFIVTIGASLVLFLCLGGIVLYLKPDDHDDSVPHPPTKFTGLPTKRETPSVPITPTSSVSTDTSTSTTEQTGGNQSSLHEELLQVGDGSEA